MQDSGRLSLQACRVLEVQINDQVGTGALFYAEVFLSPRVAFAILPVRASLPLDSPCSAHTPPHELGVPPAAALPVPTEHTVPLETRLTETRATVTCRRAGLHGQPPPPRIRPAECATSLPVPNLAGGSATQVRTGSSQSGEAVRGAWYLLRPSLQMVLATVCYSPLSNTSELVQRGLRGDTCCQT